MSVSKTIFAAFQECIAKGIPVHVTGCDFNQELWQPEVCMRAFKERLKLTDCSASPHSESPATPAQFLAGYHNEDRKVRPVFFKVSTLFNPATAWSTRILQTLYFYGKLKAKLLNHTTQNLTPFTTYQVRVSVCRVWFGAETIILCFCNKSDSPHYHMPVRNRHRHRGLRRPSCKIVIKRNC